MTASPNNNPSTTDLLDSDGVPDMSGNNVAHFTVPETDNNGDSSTDFGFTATSGFTNPGTGTPGFWKNHPEAWPVSSVTVGGVTYTKDSGDRDPRQPCDEGQDLHDVQLSRPSDAERRDRQ